MHVILTTSLFGGVNGNAGDLLPVADQADADALVRVGIARYAPEEPAEQAASSQEPSSKSAKKAKPDAAA